MNILIVEDESYVAELLRRALEGFGNQCRIAHDAHAAEALLADESIEGLTLDLGMPGQDGLDWLESLAELRPEIGRKTLVITGKPLDKQAVERVARCGAGVLAKPFTLDGLERAVRSQIDRPAPAAD